MGFVETLVVAVHVLLSIALIALILIQHGKGADAGAAFGSGASQTVFGAQGSASFLQRLTSWMAVLFFATSFTLAVFAKQRADIAPDEGIPGIPAITESAADQPAPQSQAGEGAEKNDVPALDATAGEAGDSNAAPDLQ